MRQSMIMLAVLLLAVLAACSNADDDSDASDQPRNPKSGDLWEETASKDELPGFLDESTDNMQTLYSAVAQNRDLLEQIPCYCGCGQSADHTSNYDCFVHDNGGESITWDDHATRCQACLDIASLSIGKSIDGTSVKDIRQAIEEKYEDDYAEPTPTPAI